VSGVCELNVNGGVGAQDATKRDELLKPTNPAAQRAALASDAQLKVGGQSLTKLKPKPLHSLVTTGKVSWTHFSCIVTLQQNSYK